MYHTYRNEYLKVGAFFHLKDINCLVMKIIKTAVVVVLALLE